MAHPRDINGSMPFEPESYYLRCDQCPLWIPAPDSRVWGFCTSHPTKHDPHRYEGMEYTKASEGCEVYE